MDTGIELDDLLNDALADFDKPAANSDLPSADEHKDLPAGSNEMPKNPADVGSGASNSVPGLNMPPPEDIFKQFFDTSMTKRLAEEWNSALKELEQDDPTLATHFEKLSATLDSAIPPESTPSGQNATKTDEISQKPVDFEKVMKDTLSGLDQSTDRLKNMSNDDSEQNLLSQMENLGLGPGMGDMMGGMPGLEGGLMQMMEGMMQNLLSKDVLYPTMKEISKEYPDWLRENRTKLLEEEYLKFEKQNELITKICESFEEERPDENPAVKRTRLDKMMRLVEKMQECGNPPEDLIKKCGGGSAVDVEKFFGSGGGEFGPDFLKGNMNPDQCCVM